MNRSIFLDIHALTNIIISLSLLGFFFITGTEYASIPLSVAAVIGTASLIPLLLWYSGQQFPARIALISIDCLVLMLSFFILGPVAPLTILAAAALTITTVIFIVIYKRVQTLRKETLRQIEDMRAAMDVYTSHHGVDEIPHVDAEQAQKTDTDTPVVDTAHLFSPARVMHSVIDVLAYPIRINTIDTAITIPDTLSIRGPRDAFVQICMNAISNCIDALTQTSEPKIITVSSNTSLSYVWIHISDTGAPIATDLFGNNAKLSQSRDLIEKDFNGSMLIESSDDKGTIVSFKIPLQESQP